MPFIAGLTGPSGSGKTFLVKGLKALLKDQLTVLSLDMYYRPRAEQAKDSNGFEIFDLPSAIDEALSLAHLNALIGGNSIEHPQYGFNNRYPEQSPMLVLQPAPIILIEGIFIPALPNILRQMQFTVYLDETTEICKQRRLLRDQQERGYTAEEIEYRYEMHRLYALEAFLEPWKKQANYLIPPGADTLQEATKLALSLRKSAGLL